MNQISGKLTYAVIILFSWLPFPIINVLSDILFFLLFHVTKYRKAVVVQNLKQSFPTKSDDEINELTREFFRHLSDIILASVKSFTISEKQLSKRFQLKNIEVVHQYRAENKNAIIVFGHYGNWECLGLSVSIMVKPEVYSLYRKIKNPILNNLIAKNRGRFGLNLIPEKQAYKTVFSVLNETKHWSVIGFGADQSAHPSKGIWVDFLGQKTLFVTGPERYAKKANVPILFIDVKKVKRGQYVGTFETLIEDPSKYKEGEIIEKFANRLEQQIIEDPTIWLWSHKRWKHKYNPK